MRNFLGRKNLKKSFNEAYSGLGNTARVIVLEEGLEFKKTIMPLEDAQFLQSRIFSVQEMARWLNIPPHKLKDLSKATYSNIEMEQMSYYQDTLRPWLERWESVMHTKLLTGRDQEKAFIKTENHIHEPFHKTPHRRKFQMADVRGQFFRYTRAQNRRNGFQEMNCGGQGGT